MVRVVKMSKLSKLIRVTRMLRVLKIMQKREHAKISSYLVDYLKVDQGLERLFHFTLVFFISCHIVSCLWIFVAAVQSHDYKGTWI